MEQYVAQQILKVRDALLKGDTEEAYHELYAIAAPGFDKFADDVWTEIEKAAAQPASNTAVDDFAAKQQELTPEQLSVMNKTSARSFEKAASTQQGAVWVKASEYLPKAESEYRPYRRKRDDAEYDYGEIYITTDEGEIFLDIDNERRYDRQSYERWKDFEILDESTPSKESDAVAIMLWAFSNIDAWDKRAKQVTLADGRVVPTEQLYELFKKK